MSRHLLSKDFVKELNENQNVEKATEWVVHFTSEFKQKAYEESQLTWFDKVLRWFMK